MTHILHINDNNLLIQRTDEAGGNTLGRSQGYAWLAEDQVMFDLNSDQSPVSQCRLVPQQINSRYWQQCAQTAIAANGAGMRHAADLIWKHLALLKVKYDLTELALVVPAHYRETHLQLLLGVAKANDLEVSALISKPVLAMKKSNFPLGEAFHIDVQLHQTVVSKLMVSETEVSLGDIEVKSELGLHSLQESLLHTLQESFIRTDRFDPLHNADTEQQLFDQLFELVKCAGRGEKANLGVQLHSKLYHSSIEPSDIQAAFSDLLSVIDTHSSQPVIVDMNAEFDLSGFSGRAGQSLIWVDNPSPVSNSLACHKNDHGNVIYQISLPITNTESEAQSPSVKSERSTVSAPDEALNNCPTPATHLMQFGLVVPLAQAKVSTNGAILSLSFTKQASDFEAMLYAGDLQIVNDLTRVQLQANDRLMSPIADGVITAVTLLTKAAATRH